MPPGHTLDHIGQKTAQTPGFEEVVRRLQDGQRQVLFHSLPTTLGAFLLAHVHRSLKRSALVVTADEDQAEIWRDNLQAILGEAAVSYFPAWDNGLYDRRSPSPEISGLRIEAVARLQAGKPTITIAPAAALLSPLIPPHALELGTLELKVGATFDPDRLAAHLADCGFERVPMVDGLGQFSARGGIFDIYSVGLQNPLRCEFFGDEIDSMRYFDLTSQRSLEPCESALVLPAREVLLIDPFYEDFSRRLHQAQEQENINLEILLDALELGTNLEGFESWMHLLYDPGAGLFDYLEDPLVLVEELDDLASGFESAEQPAQRDYQRRQAQGNLLPPEKLSFTAEWAMQRLEGATRLLGAPVGQAHDAIRFDAQVPPNFQGELEPLRREIERLDQADYAVHILSETRGQSSRLEELFENWTTQIAFDMGTLHRGFLYPAAGLALLNDHEIFSRQRRRYRYRRFSAAKPIANFNALQRGDFVVHVDHGIGRYLGTRHLEIGGRGHDCLEVTYQGSDKVFVPVEQLDRLRKYSSSDGQAPFLNKLGSNAWEKLKERTRQEIFKMAGELIQLYAERKARPGFEFSADTSLHRALEASFPFQETPDQLRAIEEVRADMESPHPMDRLVCGDVGYGKTEVAVRAAFKAVCDSKQVAVLVPTTILAQQHYQTFSERMAHTPARIEVLSRFRTTKEQKKVVEQVKSGRVDVLIGTHRLLSKDIRFRDLGLLVIDEEQRFGVKHKEKLKALKRQVDVVTLTATPIPRTLHMSLMSARDMSVINTPPQDRLPIHTEIIAFDEDRIIEAITREIERDGQVYFVHNRIRSIHSLAEHLSQLLPQVRFAVAHGQMPPRQLEGIMFDFLEGKYDCLISTMIIESGIDIPSVNTILVNRADMLGLAQLYQIRGRVGRSKERAFAYLLVPKGKRLTKKSRLRLRAIEEFADLGSGFNIAMRDLEIRGAGNLVGAQQHGFISAVGFDLYCRLLDEAIRGLKGEEVGEVIEPDIQIPTTAFIPADYVPDADQKMEFYQRLADAQRVVDLLSIREELQDRFGRLPEETRSLMSIMEIKVMARQLSLEAVQLERDMLRLVFPEQRQPSRGDIQNMVEKSSVRLEFVLDTRFVIEVRVGGRDDPERLERSRDIVEELL